MPPGRNLLPYLAFVAVAAWFVVLWQQAGGGMVAYDIYQYWLPNMLYGVQRVRAGGSGLLWNPFQNCGQPALGISSTAMLYPLNVLFLGLDADRVLRLHVIANFAIAGTGMYWLARELGAGRAAALCAAFAFELGSATVDVSTWTPQVSDAYVWLPTTMLFCERLLRAPSFANATGMGASIAVSLLSGSPQIMLFTYQLVALRTLFEYATRRPLPGWRPLAAVAGALVLGPLLDAVQLLPGVQTAANSVRGGGLNPAEIRVDVRLTLASLRQTVLRRSDQFNPFLLVPTVLAVASWARAATRRRAIFYAIAGALYLVLAFGPATPLFAAYVRLPFGTLFREPLRFSWVASFCLAVLTGLGADAILRCPRRAIGRALLVVASMSATAAAFCWVWKGPPRSVESALLATALAAALLVTRGAVARRLAAVLLVIATAANLLTYGSPGFPPVVNGMATRQLLLRRLMPDHRVYSKYADVFATVRTAMTPQDRAYIVHANDNYALAPKVASLFQIPSIDDYEPQPSRRWAEYLVMLRTGSEMINLNQVYFPQMDRFLPNFRRPLLDLAAVRYVIVDASIDSRVGTVTPPLYPLAVSPDLQVVVYENRSALPRARYVPRVRHVPDLHQQLRSLAAGRDDPRAAAFVDAPVGFAGGDDAGATGTVEFLVDEPERVVLRVRATARGFLHLADQYDPGWRATVNGAATSVLRANYVFRAVEVPAGESVVEFRYAPAAVWTGAAISACTIGGLALVGALAWRRRRARSAGQRAIGDVAVADGVDPAERRPSRAGRN